MISDPASYIIHSSQEEQTATNMRWNLYMVLSSVSSMTVLAFHASHLSHRPRVALLLQSQNSRVEEYRNTATRVLSNFLPKEEVESTAENAAAADPLGLIDFNASKIRKLPISRLAALLDRELYEKEWFVTGNVNPTYFSDNFQFQDPDVKLSGIEDYARGVFRLFDQESSRAEIISTQVISETKITVTWRLSGKVNIGPGLVIKPYICYTDFTINDQGLICFQEDRFDIPGWDILLSAIFPFLIGKVTAPPAPPVEPRIFNEPTKLDLASSLDALMRLFS